MKNIKFEYQVPITSTINSDENFMINGVAINATTTRNGHVFLADELQKSAKSLKNKPLLKDHNNSVDSIVGRVTNKVSFNTEKEQVLFEAKVIDKDIQEKIAEGLIDSVSVGAIVKEIEYDEKDETKEILRGIEFLELSLVAIPADKGATFATAIMESLKSNEPKVELRQNKEEEKMSENTKILQEENDSLKKELQEYKEKEAVIKAEEEKTKLREDIKKDILNDLVKKEESEENEEEPETEEEPEAEAPEEEPEAPEAEEPEVEEPETESEPEGEEKMKGKVNNETIETEELDSFVFETSGKGASFFKEKIDNPRFARD